MRRYHRAEGSPARSTEPSASMTSRAIIERAALAAILAAAAVAGCSSNAGFGAPPPYSGPQGGNPTPPPGGLSTSPYPGETLAPDASPTPNTPLVVDSATARFAYDGYPADPVKAARLVEITFALNNPGASPLPVSDLAVAADTNKPTHVGLSLKALPNQDTVESLIAIAPPKDFSKVKQLNLTFSGDKNAMLAQFTTDFPALADPTMTPLDKKRPAGGVSIDDVSVTSIQAPGSGFHYDLTFSVTNASTTDASIAYFTVTPPKSDTVKLAIPVKVSARSEMAPISIVVPLSGKAKSLPSGKYDVTASDGKSTIGQGSGPLL